MKNKKIYNFLRVDFLTDESAFYNWRIIFFIVCLVLIMITSAHQADKKVIKMKALHKKKRKLRAEYVESGAILMRMKMESNVRQKATKIGLKPSKTPPIKITVTHKK